MTTGSNNRREDDTERRAQNCPLCGQDNRCAMVRGSSPCWCAEATIPAEVLAAIPSDLRGVACVCPRCASGEVSSPCAEICDLDPTSQTCRGCHRTLPEIAAWPRCTAAEKRAVLRRIARAAADRDGAQQR
jgi:predicted Fe-S protein YdhL (DUF1289 family)